MHELFTEVLCKKDLSKAGDLFSVSEHVIVNDLNDVIARIQEIASSPDYAANDHDQSIVEICITRVTSAVRETSSISLHAEALVSLLETCLNHNLHPTVKDVDPPHAKIASDIISCIFLNYHHREVMSLALPIAVKLLHKGNRELSRNVSSYLSLAAIDSADLLAMHTQPIIDSVISGNYSLSRVLPQIYEVKKEPIHDHVMTLVSLLPQCDTNEKLGLLTLFALIARNKPSLLEPSLPQLIDCLCSSEASIITLQILAELCVLRPASFTEHLGKIKNIVEQQPLCLPFAIHIMASVGRLSKVNGKAAIDYISLNLHKVDSSSLGVALREVQLLCMQYPSLLTESLLLTVNKCSEKANPAAKVYIQQLRNDYSDMRKTSIIQHIGGVTAVKIGGNYNDVHISEYSEEPKLFICNNNNNELNSSSVLKSGLRYQRHKDTSRSTGRLVSASNNSMPKLSALPHSTGRLGSSTVQLNKSVPKLNSSYALAVNRSVTVLSQPTRPFSVNVGATQFTGSCISGSHLGASRLTCSPTHTQCAYPTPSFVHNSTNVEKNTVESVHLSVTNEASNIDVPKSSDLSGSLKTVSSTMEPSKDVVTSPSNSTDTSHNTTYQNSSFQKEENSHPKSTPGERISVFEPFAMRDTVQHFCEKHLDKIKAYMVKVFVKLPLPVRCGIEERKNRKHAKMYFTCQGKGDYCLYSKQFFTMKTRNPRIWIHLMFLALQARSHIALSTREAQVSSLKNCWDVLKCDVKSFVTLVTSAFPSARDIDLLMQELRNARFFDVFEYNGVETYWGCFLCNHPDRARGFVEEDKPVIEGQLKEKKSKWKIFRKWRTRYFTLSGAQLSYRDSPKDDIVTEKGGIEVHEIRSVKVSRGGRHIPRAFEVFTENKTFVLKAKDSSNAEEWVKCLSIAVAHCHSQDGPRSGSKLSTSIPRSFKYGQRTSLVEGNSVYTRV